MIVVAAGAPILPIDLRRIAKRAILGLARTGSRMSSGSGEYVICFSIAYRIDNQSVINPTNIQSISGDSLNPFFSAVIEATQEAGI